MVTWKYHLPYLEDLWNWFSNCSFPIGDSKLFPYPRQIIVLSHSFNNEVFILCGAEVTTGYKQLYDVEPLGVDPEPGELVFSVLKLKFNLAYLFLPLNGKVSKRKGPHRMWSKSIFLIKSCSSRVNYVQIPQSRRIISCCIIAILK